METLEEVMETTKEEIENLNDRIDELDQHSSHNPDIPNKIGIGLECMNCIDDKPEEVSSRKWSRCEFGVTPTGFQVWCNRCDLSMLDYTSPDYEM